MFDDINTELASLWLREVFDERSRKGPALIPREEFLNKLEESTILFLEDYTKLGWREFEPD